MQRIAVLLVFLLISPVYSASPPPGEPDVENDICSTWNSQSGICDDYQSVLDGSSISEWIKSSIVLNVVDADSVSLTISTAVHELSHSDLDLEDLDLEDLEDLDLDEELKKLEEELNQADGDEADNNDEKSEDKE